jgi:alpha-N-arabinofuranosidase
MCAVAEKALPPGPVTLCIDASRESYTFSVTTTDEEPVVLASGETRYLSTEVAGGFTGVYIGMYAQSSGDQLFTPAYFDWFDYLPT